MDDKPMQSREVNSPSTAQCGAKTRSGRPCRSHPVTGKRRCRMHGGAPGTGAPRGERNGNYRHGRRTLEAMAERRRLMEFIREARRFARRALE
jgi:hypothetical protein